MKIVIAIIGAMFLVTLTTCVVMSGWNWFLAPLGLPTINFAHTMGLTVFLSALRLKIEKVEPTLGKDDALERLGNYVFSLIIGWAMMFGLSYLI